MYLLIIGSPRSGTTLLASMIGAHTDVAMLIEDKSFSIKKLTSKKVFANKLCIPNQIDLNKKATGLSLLLKKRFGITSYPTSKFSIEDYLKLEGIKIINIVRDYNDVINSNVTRGEGGKQRKIEHTKAKEWWAQAVQIMHELAQKHPEKVITVSYEDLVTEPEKLLNKITGFLHIEFQPVMLEGYKFSKLYPGEKEIDKSRAYKSKNGSANGYAVNQQIDSLYNNLLKFKINP